MTNRLIAIGDIHGCSVALGTLLDAIDPRPDDTIVVLGDVIDHGPDAKGVIQQLIDLSSRCRLVVLTGSHEEMLLKAIGCRDDRRFWENCGGKATRWSYPARGDRELIDPEHLRFLRETCRDYFETDGFNLAHANYRPDLPMAEQSGQALRWEFVRPERMVPHSSGKTIIAGHTPQNCGEILDLGFLKVIDTDCSRGDWLTALDARSGQVIQTNQRGDRRSFQQMPT